MLLMVIERFRAKNPDAVAQRFRARGRLIPDGSNITYITSWMAADGSCCYQLMDAPAADSLEPWLAQWRDLVEFDITPVLTSADYWTAHAPH